MALKIPVEVHLYAQGGHGFNMGTRSELRTLQKFPDRITDWLHDNGWLTQAAAQTP